MKSENLWLLIASTDGNMVDYSTLIISPSEPRFWRCNSIAENHGCEFWSIEQFRLPLRRKVLENVR